MHKMTIELNEKNFKDLNDLRILKNRIRMLANESNIFHIDGNEYFGNGNDTDFENFAIFMIKLMEDKEFLDNCKTWLWDEFEESDEAHYIDNVLEEVLKRMSEE